jgi:hypothetical protein
MIEGQKRLYIEPGRPARGRRVVKVPERKTLRDRTEKSSK